MITRKRAFKTAALTAFALLGMLFLNLTAFVPLVLIACVESLTKK